MPEDPMTTTPAAVPSWDAALAYLSALCQFGFQPGLDTTRRLCAAMGNPEAGLRFIHVAGTNGKGSVCAFLDAMYRAAGFRVGLYTSPHLVRFGERIQVNRVPVSDEILARGVAELREKIAGLAGPEPTFFEFTTALALRCFQQAGVDLVIWETGLGGRLDATNVVTPLASVITNIGLDHQQVLGPTLAHIAAEKAGIIKSGVPVLTATEDPDARAILEFKARELDAPFLAISAPQVARLTLPVGLRGSHQRTNAALAATTVRLLRAFLPVSDEQLAEGLAATRWPGRLQELQRGPQRLVLDGAHNLPGVHALRASLPELIPGVHPTLILGALNDKDWREMVRLLAPVAGRILTVPVASSRTVSAADLKAAVVASGAGRPVRAASSLAEALRWASADPVVLITGSLYLVGEALELLGPPSAALAAERDLNEWGGTR
ncbi:MAG: bifunctional folylpolyglutamate synthase/dihydrofolate synthase [Verrucomicrobia bacterium]|nr:bifunctional folylpolyglutamate synthase/dihydrofolate synthase [Verrucomicrobiota bacterium]